MLVGGSVDKTAGTLTAPDLDCNINWNLQQEITKHLEIVPTDDGESGQYLVKVGEMNVSLSLIFLYR